LQKSGCIPGARRAAPLSRKQAVGPLERLSFGVKLQGLYNTYVNLQYEHSVYSKGVKMRDLICSLIVHHLKAIFSLKKDKVMFD
jgi:hypothetical protein